MKDFPRIIQFIPDEKLGNIAGEKRIDKMLNMGIDQVVVFTNSKEDNQFGIEYLIHKTQNMNIPMTVYFDLELTQISQIDKPQNMEIMQIFERIKLNSDAYKKKFRDSIKSMRKSYYDSLKNQPSTKLLNQEDEGKIKWSFKEKKDSNKIFS